MGILKDKFIKNFALKESGGKSWMIGSFSNNGLYCPICGNKDATRLAFNSNGKISTFHCVKCGSNMSLLKYLYKLHLKQYIDKYTSIDRKVVLTKRSLFKEKEQEDKEELPEVKMPLFFKRLKYSSYLNKRGATLPIYSRWIIGKTDFEKSLKDYIIFGIPENGRLVGWVARAPYSKDYIDNWNKTHNYKILRWRNSVSDFGKIVFGLDEISSHTEKLIIVEGITSKLNVDCKLKLYKDSSSIKCCCTFGKKTTKNQLEKIRNKSTNLKELILFYDSDAIPNAKKTAFQYMNIFENVKLAFCSYKNEQGIYKDAGDLTKEELEETLKETNLQTPLQFFENKLPKKALF